MEAAGGGEEALGLAQADRQGGDDLGRDLGSRRHRLVTRSLSVSSPALPQTPQALVEKKWRSSPASSGSGSPSASSTSMMLAQASPRIGAGRTRSTSSRRRITPSAKRKPRASSASAPGVRMVTATVWRRPSWTRRISSGSSVASWSSRDSATPDSTR